MGKHLGLFMKFLTFLPDLWDPSYCLCDGTTCPVLLLVRWQPRDVCRSGMTDTRQDSSVLLINCIPTVAKAAARVINKL